MEWNVFRYNMNLREIETYNIFNHGTFLEYVKKAALKYKNKDEFVKQLKLELRYCFWRRSEYEIFISPWGGYYPPGKDVKKIDIYEQVMANFEIFADYVWNNKEKLYEI
jgi:hypothetical protein